jgi:predicted TIM-barrel fold metal-dependent hydrolase
MGNEAATIVDCHNHLTDDFNIDSADSYFVDLESAGVSRVMVCAISHTRWGGNQATLKLKRRYPERIIVFAYIDVDRDPIDDIWKYKEQGFSGLKVIQTEQRYDDQKYMKYYAEASKAEMPILFHTGFLGLRPGRYVHCDYYKPMTLDTVARYNPDLRMICAHMGNPWWDEGFLVMWKHKNIYCDMSGLSACRRDLDLWVRLFKPNGELHEATSKLVFASDQFLFGSTRYSDQYIQYHHQLFDLLGLDRESRHRILSENFLRIIGEV